MSKLPYYTSEPVNGLIYGLEPTRRGSRKLNAVAMRREGGVDWKVDYKSVPLKVRRDAKEFFTANQYGRDMRPEVAE
jgi:hypothetical protein